MAPWVDLLRSAAALNIVLLVGLSYLWVRNYLQFRSKHTLGLAVFAVLLLVENVTTVYIFAVHPVLTPWIVETAPIAQRAITALKLIQFVALLALAWTAWD